MLGEVDQEDGEEGTVDKGILITHKLSHLIGVNPPTHCIQSTPSRRYISRVSRMMYGLAKITPTLEFVA